MLVFTMCWTPVVTVSYDVLVLEDRLMSLYYTTVSEISAVCDDVIYGMQEKTRGFWEEGFHFKEKKEMHQPQL